MPRYMGPLQAAAHRGIGPVVVACAAWAALCGAQEEPVCRAGDKCTPSGSDSYHWPMAHGHMKHYGRSAFPGPFNLTTSLAWSWQHPDGLYNDMPMGASIDDQNNVYVAADQGLYKLDANGKTLWRFNPGHVHGRQGNLGPDGCALYGGAAIFDTIDGRVFSVDMETGAVNWERQVGSNICFDTGAIAVHGGIAIFETDNSDGACRCLNLRGVNVSNGDEVWSYRPDNPVWDLMPQFPDDNTFVFQDLTGKMYRNHLADGTNMWKNGGFPNSWTDGTQGLGPNGLVYGVHTDGCGGPDCHGHLTAYRLEDGSEVWSKSVPRPPNSSPVVGRLGKTDHLSVVIPIGQQPNCDSAASLLWHWAPTVMFSLPSGVQALAYGLFHRLTLQLGDGQQWLWGNPDLPTDIMVFDAEKGDLEWKWTGPTYKRFQCPGDESGFLPRYELGIRTASCPTPWGAPRIGADGTIYAGNQNGFFYAINDWNENRIIEPGEVSSFDCEAEFSSIGSAHGDGMVVMASGVKVWAWKV